MQPLLFFGTPDFAVPTLRALAASEFRPSLVVSQPTRPAGRGKKLTEPPVVLAARELGLDCVQVARVRDPEFLEQMAQHRPEIAIVVAFGQIFPSSLLQLPRRGCVNLHASLLPRWRGAAPIQAAIRSGDAETGVTTMVMEEGLDSGPTLLERAIPIEVAETAGELSVRLAEIGAELMIETLKGLLRAEIVPQPQESAAATYAGKVSREDTRLSWGLPAAAIERAVRAYQPKPGAELSFAEESIKVLAARVDPESRSTGASSAPARVLAVESEILVVTAGDGAALVIERAQRSGRGPVTGGELARSLGLKAGDPLT